MKSAKCKTPFLHSINTLQGKTYTKVKTFIRLYKHLCDFWFQHFKINLTVIEVDIVSAILVDGYNRQHILLNFSKSTSVLDIVITKSVKISAGPPFIIPWENEKKGYKMDFPHFDIITEPVDSPVERLKN